MPDAVTPSELERTMVLDFSPESAADTTNKPAVADKSLLFRVSPWAPSSRRTPGMTNPVRNDRAACIRYGPLYHLL